MIADQFAMKFNCLLDVAASFPTILAEPGLNTELALDQILPGMAFIIHLVTYAQSLIGADPIVISELTAVIGDDVFPQSPLQERLKVNVQEHTGFLIRRQRAGKDGS
jgi:hypothetical protein